ncbi:MAG: porin [Marinosulfonomonas sp.]|nr:MAG: porin [Marinosulfonomonas sp.]
MKKVLLTTTALVAFAGAASAEVTLSGYAEIGLIGGSAAGFETQFHNDFDVKFTLSGETDNGLTFGATIDLDEVSGGISNTGNPSAVFISGGFGKITMGDTDGAFDWAMQEVGIGSALADDHTTHAGFNFNSGLDGLYDGQVLRYDNTFGDFGVAVSATLDDSGVGSAAWGVGVKYKAALGGVDLGLGLGYQSGDVVTAAIAAAVPTAGPDGLDSTLDDTPAVVAVPASVTGSTDVWGVSVDAKFGGGFRAIVSYSDADVAGFSTTHTGLGLGYTTGALTVSANYGVYNPAVGLDTDGYGLAVNYDLGGGAVVMAGYGSASDAGAPSVDTWSVGLGLSF